MSSKISHDLAGDEIFLRLVGGNLAQVEQIFSGIVLVGVCVLNKEQVYLLNTDPLTKNVRV